MTTDAAQAAKEIRKAIKAHGLKARVRSSNYSQGSSVNVTLTDELPATVAAVADFAKKYQWEDNHSNDLPQARFVFVEVDFSEAVVQAAKDYVAANYPADCYDLDMMPYRILRGSEESTFWAAYKPRKAA